MPALPQLNSSLLRSSLKLKSLTSESTLRAHHPQAVAFLESSGIKPGQIRLHAAKILASGTLASTLLLSPAYPPANAQSTPALPAASDGYNLVSSTDLHLALIRQLQPLLPTTVTPLTPDQEAQASQIIHQLYGVHATPVLQGERLNRSYGYIGQEQHLKRFPGDTLDQHSEPLKEGLAPGLGGWGYFAHSKSELTPQLVDVEKYYVAVQTLYLPDWNTRTPEQRQWWKFRKMVVVNPQNGKLMVVAVGDSGPAWWTGKHYGGSPEVMQYLNMKDGRQKGPVLMFFLDDPANEIPLGPIEYNLEKGQPLLS